MPLAIDLFCGLGGWTEGLLAEGYDVIGYDIEEHVYGAHRYPARLVVQDVLTIHGSEFRNADLIVASPPCQEYSYMAMPWAKAKAKAKAIRSDASGKKLEDLNRLFDSCFRLQREAIEASGRNIPLIVENVRGAQPWVGRARWNYGSFYLWGDVPALMPPAIKAQKFNPDGSSHGQGSWFKVADSKERGSRKVPGFRFDGSGRSFQTAAVKSEGSKVPSQSGRRTDVGNGVRFTSRDCGIENSNDTSAEKLSRKAASAMIAKIPLQLSRHIAKTFKPKETTC